MLSFTTKSNAVGAAGAQGLGCRVQDNAGSSGSMYLKCSLKSACTGSMGLEFRGSEPMYPQSRYFGLNIVSIGVLLGHGRGFLSNQHDVKALKASAMFFNFPT